MILKRSFYNRSTLDVAKDLLGCIIVRKIGKQETRALITDVEAYIGENDLACHASKGRTPRSEVLYGQPGHAYVYLIYGMYFILNVVTEKKEFPAAVMFRAIKIDGVEYKQTNGPGKICKVLQIDKSLHNWDLTKGEKLWIEKPKKTNEFEITEQKRVGIDYALHCKEYLWRFTLAQYAERKNSRYK